MNKYDRNRTASVFFAILAIVAAILPSVGCTPTVNHGKSELTVAYLPVSSERWVGTCGDVNYYIRLAEATPDQVTIEFGSLGKVESRVFPLDYNNLPEFMADCYRVEVVNDTHALWQLKITLIK